MLLEEVEKRRKELIAIHNQYCEEKMDPNGPINLAIFLEGENRPENAEALVAEAVKIEGALDAFYETNDPSYLEGII